MNLVIINKCCRNFTITFEVGLKNKQNKYDSKPHKVYSNTFLE